MKKKSPLLYNDQDMLIKTTHEPRGLRWQSGLLPHSDEYEDGELEKTNPSKLFIVGAMAIFLIFFGLSWRLFQLQVVQGARFEQLANGNRIREQISYAPRGKIYDRNGKVLAENTIAFQLSVTPFLLPESPQDREDAIQKVSAITGLTATEITKAATSKGLEYPLPILVADKLTHEKALLLGQIEPDISGFSLDEVPTRKYVADVGLAHILGYVGRVSESDLEADTEGLLLPVDFVGKAGIEKQYDAYLRGDNGQSRTEVDALGRPVRLLAQKEPQIGKDIHLTIDFELQTRLAADIQAQMNKSNTLKGSGVLLDPDTGAVLAMVSLPYYDNNDFRGGISQKDFDVLLNDPRQPLINKVVQSGYTAGSVIKPVVASAALTEGIVTPQTIINDAGSISVSSVYDPSAPPFIFRGWRESGLGPMDVRSALAWSSNIYFYTVGGGHGGVNGLGVDKLTQYYRDFGLGEATGIDLPNEYAGRVADRAWKKDNTGLDWFVGDSYNISIGQGDMLVTPLQMTLADMAIANGGHLLKPYLVSRANDEVLNERTVRRDVAVSGEVLQIVREGMRQVLTNGTTCECTFSKVPVQVAGKSGTAQTTSDESRRPHAWYTAFAPWQDPEVYATVIIEEGSGGSQFSAPAIAGVFEQYFLQKEQ